ncbi:MAG: quinate 5-dehydrogenase [Clostridiales bacterium]|nr:quinate 5-dehydrogenase [Clostridiales bacterium]
MKRIVSVSIGSSTRNHVAEAELLGEKFIIERIGTDGDMNKAIEMIKELDGKVDAIGMGGIDLYVYSSNKRYTIKDAVPMMEAAKKTPIVDGSGLKNTLERRVVNYVNENVISLSGKKVLMVSAADRFGMAEALHSLGADITFGDVIFALNIPIPIKSYRVFQMAADMILPIASRMPFEKLYPTGHEQEINVSKYEKYFEEAEIIAGDFLFIKKYMPKNLKGKIILTNTVTSSDVVELKNRGVRMLITTTPEFNGRSFGTNVLEGVIVSLIDKELKDVTSDDYNKVLDKLSFKPRIELLNEYEQELQEAE